jgi:hypothetical protein
MLKKLLALFGLVVFTSFTFSQTFPVTVNYDRTIEKMVTSGKYDWSNPNINSKRFPIGAKGRVEVNIELVHFNYPITSDEVLRNLDRQGLRPATLPEILAFGATYPEMQREFPIVALGSVWRDQNGDRHVAYLCDYSGNRKVFLCWSGGRWHGLFRFAAVRK